MTVGLWRSSGSRMYLVCGGLLLFGAIASFLALGWERHRLAPERPEQLLKIWQAHAEKRSSHPFLYFARHTEFIVPPRFFPYPLPSFSLLHLINLPSPPSSTPPNLTFP